MMRFYHQAVAVIAALLFFSGVDLYLFVAEYTAITPRVWITVFAVIAAPLAIHRLHRHGLSAGNLGRIALWGAGYIVVSVVWYSLSPTDASMQELRDRILAVLFMLLTGIAFLVPEARKAAGFASLGVVLAMAIVNGLQMFYPDWFVMQVSTRSSGLYGNANQCGAALVIGMVIGSPLVPSRLRVTFYALVGAAVFATFSRSGIVGWLIASILLAFFDSSKKRAREFMVAGSVAVVLLAALLQVAASSGLVDGLTLDDNQAGRVTFFTTFEASDDAALERREVAAKAWGMFLDRPLQGNGLASTVQWTERSSTHNMFLYLMADHGLLGAVIFPCLLAFVVAGRPRTGAGPHWAFAAFALWSAFFSHNLLTERYQLLALAFFAMGGVEAVAARRALAVTAAPRPAAEPFPAIVRVQ